MKNNTKVRLHLSKQLFESLTKQVLAEAKMSKEAMGGGASNPTYAYGYSFTAGAGGGHFVDLTHGNLSP